MTFERLFDHHSKGILNPTHGDGFHLFSGDFEKKFLQLSKEFESNYFEIHDPVVLCGEYYMRPPILLEVVDGKCKNHRSSLADMKYNDDEIVYAIPMKKDMSDTYIISDGTYYFGNVLIIGIDITGDYSLDFMGMMKKALQKSNIQIISTKEWNDDSSSYNTKDLELTVCDKHGNYWKILFG